MATPGQVKQDILKTYNAVNQAMFVAGVSQQRVELLGDRVLILAEHRRIPTLAVLDQVDPAAARTADMALVRENKRRLAASLEAAIGIPVRTILKDYDPQTGLAATVVVFASPLPGSP